MTIIRIKCLQKCEQEVRFRFCLERHFLTFIKTERLSDESERPAKEMVVPYSMNSATIHLDKESQEFRLSPDVRQGVSL